MRAGPKLALATITLLSAWGIATVHWYQQEEREVRGKAGGGFEGVTGQADTQPSIPSPRPQTCQALHKGVIRDEELYKLKVEQFRKAAQHQGGSN